MVHSRPLWLKIGSRATHTLCVIYVPRICSHGDSLKQNSEMGKHMGETQLVKGSSELSWSAFYSFTTGGQGAVTWVSGLTSTHRD